MAKANCWQVQEQEQCLTQELVAVVSVGAVVVGHTVGSVVVVHTAAVQPAAGAVYTAVAAGVAAVAVGVDIQPAVVHIVAAEVAEVAGCPVCTVAAEKSQTHKPSSALLAAEAHPAGPGTGEHGQEPHTQRGRGLGK